MVISAKQPPIYAIVGPTASGKTVLGVELALRIRGEVVNCDSVQIYKEIQIATAKPTTEEMRGVPHHLVGYIGADIKYTAADWARDASEKIVEIEKRSARPVLVGGSGFYLRTLREPLFESPKTDEAIRHKLQQTRTEKGAGHMHNILRRVDPLAAKRLFPNDFVRVSRALEVFFQTGTRFSDHQPNRSEPPEFGERIKLIVLNPQRSAVYSKINLRTKRHFELGLVEEVKRLRESGLSDDTNALGSHGYRRVCEYLRGDRTLESALEQTQQDVRNYAKRQLTWFRKEPGAIWLTGFGEDVAVQDQLWRIISNE
ncbi:MAG: tRNA (adenosine(37)-N6)-dimethylallyltransferase MiaA [Pyrinomonadaceae bacterium]